ncbi:2-keto-4-pentenoate hydratase [Nocardioides sp. GXZ039]|uniref:2-keto-4-pentenoate hydratase n=1 Tax=Nocardioides sp. GXZ039 TaxID=3136018 RepID=UPI0030F3E900
MSAHTDAVAHVVEHLDLAQTRAVAIRPDEQWPELDLADAYAAQAALLDRRRGRGERGVGLKLGFTSEAKMRQMGVDELIVGRLTHTMEIPAGGSCSLDGLIHPRVEPEVAFRFEDGLDLADPALDDPDALVAAVSHVAAALEIIDSRYDGFRFDLPRVVADNTSAARFAVGPWHEPGAIDLSDLPVRLVVGGETAATGSTSAILGHPLNTLPRLRDLGRRLGLEVPPGAVLLAGAATEAVPLVPGTVAVEIGGLEPVAVEIEGGHHG